MSRYPMANEVELEVGMTVFWDDRPGWEGIISRLPSPETLDVVYVLADESDKDMRRELFSVKA